MHETFSQDGMYGSRAAYYDAIYHWKDYKAESARVRELLSREGIATGARVLEAACGTGNHLQHLQLHFEVSGFDISGEMLAIARHKLVSATLFAADMTDFRVQQPFDALLCLFSSIGYVFPLANLERAAACFARAVRRGGALLVEPWLTPEKFAPGRASMHTFESDCLKLCRAAVGQREGDLSILDFHWLAARSGEGVEHFTDRHVMQLYPTAALLGAFSSAGFECRFELDGLMKDRGIIIARRR
jgi:daunosaminyl-N,N-dimethyltransferase/N-dimethyltransferase